MSLDPMQPAEEIWTTQQQITGMVEIEEVVDDGDGGEETIRSIQIDKDENGNAIKPDLSNEQKVSMFAATFASAYDDYAKAGDVPGADNGTEDPSILEDFLNDTSEKTNADFGAALASYWATVKLEPGEAEELDEVVGVVNDAADFADDFAIAIDDSITKDLGTPPYYDVLISNIEEVVKQITWIVTELDTDSGVTTPYDRNIS